MKDNPFVLTFGREPIKYISRINFIHEVERNFYSNTSPNQAYMITGIRGTGKTVLLTRLAKDFEQNDDWIVIDSRKRYVKFVCFSTI